MSEFRYIGLFVLSDGSMKTELKYRVVGWSKNHGVTVRMLKSIAPPTVTYKSDSWVLNIREGRSVEVFQIKCSRKVLGVWVEAVDYEEGNKGKAQE